MNETRWTPGPWRVSQDGIFAGAHDFIADVLHPSATANAHLIAAAPELYEALRDLLQDHTVDTPAGPFVDRAEAALARARGEQP